MGSIGIHGGAASGGAAPGGGLTDTELRAADVKVTLDGEVPHVVIDSMPAGGSGLTDSELRASDVKVTLDGEDVVFEPLPAVISAGNSTTTPLTAGDTFTGTFEDVRGYASILISSVASTFADNTVGLTIEWSNDGSTIAASRCIAMETSTVAYVTPVLAQYFRVIYKTNATQSSFNLQTLYSSVSSFPSEPFPLGATDDTISASRRAPPLMAAVLFGTNPGTGNFTHICTRGAGAMRVWLDGSQISLNSDQGIAASTANRWPVQLTDGTRLTTVTAGGALLVDASATTQPVSGPLTDTQLRAADVKVTLDGEIPHVVIDSMPAGGAGLTDTELRATPVPVSGTVTASGPLTDTQLRATPVPVSGTVTASGPLTNTQLRASPVAISAGVLDVRGSRFDGDPDEGTPVVIGGVYNPTQPTFSGSGTVATFQSTVRGGVIVATGADAFVTKATTSTTGTITSVNDQATNVTLLASNVNRKGATIVNDSTVALYVKLGATASLTSFTVKMVADAYYEVPFNYTGIIDGIWASDAAGAARITELT